MTEQKTMWRRAAFAGCGCLVLVAAMAGGLIAYNWRAISAGLQRGSAAMTELMEIQRTLMTRYGTADVSVKWMSGMNYSAKEGTTRKTGMRLVVTLANPPFCATSTSMPPNRRRARSRSSRARGCATRPRPRSSRSCWRGRSSSG